MIKQAFFTYKFEKSNIYLILHDILFFLISILTQKLNSLFRFHHCHIFLWFRFWVAPARSKKSTKSVWISFFNFWCQARFNHALHILNVSFLKAVRKIYTTVVLTIYLITSAVLNMEIRVVEFSSGGYKIKNIFAKESTYPKEIIEFWELV